MAGVRSRVAEAVRNDLQRGKAERERYRKGLPPTAPPPPVGKGPGDRWRALPRWAKWTIGILALLLLISIAGGSDNSSTKKDVITSRSASDVVATRSSEPTTPPKTLADAAALVDDDHYAAALA